MSSCAAGEDRGRGENFLSSPFAFLFARCKKRKLPLFALRTNMYYGTYSPLAYAHKRRGKKEKANNNNSKNF